MDARIDDVAGLPPYLARHISLGFEAEDLVALVESIDASQRSQDYTPPRLPLEIVLMILDRVSVDDVLSWRLVNRFCRDYIDGPLLYQYVRRAVLIGVAISPMEFEGVAWDQSTEQYLEGVRYLHARFDHLEPRNVPEEDDKKGSTIRPRAIFQIDSDWISKWNCNHSLSRTQLTDMWRLKQEVALKLQPFGCYRDTMRWCIRLDGVVVGLDLPVMTPEKCFQVDFQNGNLLVEWEILLFRFLKTSKRLRELLEATRCSLFTFNHENDCLRAMRRERMIAQLDPTDEDDRSTKWMINNLRPLFGKRWYHQVGTALARVEFWENDAMELLTRFRREASLSEKELAHLRQLASDRKRLRSEISALNSSISSWQSTMLNMAINPVSLSLPSLPNDPLEWTDEQLRQEERRVQNWRSQKKILAKISELVDASREAMTLPEDVFDELGSDI